MTKPAASPIIAIIVAVADNGVIGANGKMPWHLPSELKYFRARTMGKPVIMGRRTFQSVGKPLSGRDNIVVSRDSNFRADGVTVVLSLEAALAAAQTLASKSGAVEVMVIGGADMYRQALPWAGRLYLTRIRSSPPGDAFFPLPDPSEWRLVEEADIPGTEGEGVRATAHVYDRLSAPAAAR